MIYFSHAWLIFAVDVSLKALLLAVAAGLVLLAVRLRDTNLRHRVWTAVLGGMLAMPLLVCVTPAIPLPSWLTEWMHIAPLGAEPVAVAPALSAPPPPAPAEQAVQPPQEFPPRGDYANREFAAPAFNSPPREEHVAQPALLPATPPIAIVPAEIPVSESPSWNALLVGNWQFLLASLYFVVATFFLLRLLVGLLLARRLIGRASPLQLPAGINLSSRKNLRFLESSSILVPVTLGLWRPVVLLPVAWREWSETKLQAVLAHELAHVRRADWLVLMLAELNIALYWFHPVAWFLKRRLSELAERNCDDAVLAADGDRTQYANYLLEVAASLSQAGTRYRPPRHSVAMARQPSVETRIEAILDSSRPLARRLSARVVLGLLVIGIPCILLAAALQPAAEKSASEVQAVDAKSAEQKTSDDKANDEKVSDDKTTDTKALPTNKEASKTEAAAPHIVHGRIVLANGKPAASADVAVVGRNLSPQRGGDLSPQNRIIAETKTDAEGNYRFELKGITPETYHNVCVFAATGDSALAWKKLSLAAAETDVTLQLQPQEIILGRLVDRQGQPIVGARLRINSIREKAAGDRYTENEFSLYEITTPPAACPLLAATDELGRFAVPRIPKGYGVSLAFDGDERFAPQFINLNTGESEERPEKDGTYRPLIKNSEPGKVVEVQLAPAQWFTGTIRFADTGEPVPNARLTIWARQQDKEYGSMMSLPGKADEHGRYRICPYPGARFGVTAYPPAGTPYLPLQSDEIKWPRGAQSQEVDVKLPRGVLVRGQVLEQGTDTPIAGAAIQYHCEEANNKNYAEKILTGWEDIQLSDAEGKFAIAVLPGPGRLLVHAPKNEYLIRETSDREIYNGQPGGTRNYAHAVERIDPAVDAAPLDVTLHLKRGATVSGTIVDQAGKPIAHAKLLSRLHIGALELAWRGFPLEFNDGKFSISGLAPDQEYPCYFFYSERRLGATAMLKAGMDPPRIVLQPYGQAKLRFVDDAGKPIPNSPALVRIVVAPGASYGHLAYQTGKLAADVDFPWNYDRVNHKDDKETDNEGRLTIPALIPGATYRIETESKDKKIGIVVSKQFQAPSGTTLDLGDIIVGSEAPLEDKTEPAKATKPASDNIPTLGTDNVEPVEYHGHVLDAAGKPAAKSSVRFSGNSDDLTAPWSETLTTDAEGRFRVRLRLNHLRMIDVLATNADKSQLMKFQFPRHNKEVPNDIRIPLAPARVVRLKVVDKTGAPIEKANALVSLEYTTNDLVQTGADGIAQFTIPANQRVLEVAAWKEHLGFDFHSYDALPDSNPDKREVFDKSKLFPESGIDTLTLYGATPLSVKVIDEDGKPLQGISVYPHWLQKSIGASESYFFPNALTLLQRTNAQGIATVKWMPSWQTKKLEFIPVASGYDLQRFEFTPDKNGRVLEMTLNRLVPIRGSVRDASGATVAGARITADGAGYTDVKSSWTATTDKAGAYEVKVAPNQIYMVKATAPGLVATPQDGFVVYPGKPVENKDFTLRKATRLFGKLLAEETQQPIEGGVIVRQTGRALDTIKDITFQRPNSFPLSVIPQPSMYYPVNTDKQGRFELLVGDGDFSVSSIWPGGKVEKFRIAGDVERELTVHIKLPEETILAGKVKDKDTEHVLGRATVTGISRSQLGKYQTRTNEKGDFRIQRTPAAMFLHAVSADKKLATILEVAANQNEVLLNVEPVGTARGRLLKIGKNEPWGGVIVHFGVLISDRKLGLATYDFGGSVTTAADGTFELKGLVPGWEYSCWLDIQDDNGIPVFAGITVQSGETKSLGDVTPDTFPPARVDSPAVKENDPVAPKYYVIPKVGKTDPAKAAQPAAARANAHYRQSAKNRGFSWVSQFGSRIMGKQANFITRIRPATKFLV